MAQHYECPVHGDIGDHVEPVHGAEYCAECLKEFYDGARDKVERVTLVEEE